MAFVSRDRAISICLGLLIGLICLFTIKVLHGHEVRGEIGASLQGMMARTALVTRQANIALDGLGDDVDLACTPAYLNELRTTLFINNAVHDILILDAAGGSSAICSGMFGVFDRPLAISEPTFQSQRRPGRFIWLDFKADGLPESSANLFIAAGRIGVLIDQRVLSGSKVAFDWEAFTRPPDEDYGIHLYGTPGLFNERIAADMSAGPLSTGISAVLCNEREQLGFCLAGHYSGTAILERHTVLIVSSIAFCLLIVAVAQRRIFNRLRYQKSIPGRIARAIHDPHGGGFHCHYQPIVDLESGRIEGVEALARFEDEIGPLPPDVFIPEIDRVHDTWAFTERIIEIVTDDLATVGPAAQAWTVSINFFQNDLREDNLPNITASRAVARAHRDGLAVNCEVVEAGSMLRMDKEAALSHLRALGFTVSIDDFGAGFSNLAEVRRMAPDYLKIDKQFVQGIDVSETSLRASLVPNIIDIARQMQAHVIAEGIETQDQLAALKALGVRLGQGYLLARPLAIEALAQLSTQTVWLAAAASDAAAAMAAGSKNT
ncbi:EAL domain-containing protein [Stappia stellulata]|uniref:EAL domain-containing protein n=1 Tax=Stappia stellulata TaxID=71235 RepID=UPI00048B15E4|nr:EAL domain-containing protein [Stappia stellulata]